jgi:uncharacterized membrane protein AbrB (regulator of aidB expression)
MVIRGTFALQTVVAFFVAFVTYAVVAALAAVAFVLFYRLTTELWPWLIQFTAAIIGASVGIYAAKEACEAVLRDYSRKAVCILFMTLAALTIAAAAFFWDRFDWDRFIDVVRAVTAAIAAVLYFWSHQRAEVAVA